jgi:hypothetical protein
MRIPLVIRRNGDKTVTVAATCPLCGKPSMVENIPEEPFDAWWLDGHRNGPFIQNALPTLSSGDREVLISGTHNKCFDDMFPPDSDWDDG